MPPGSLDQIEPHLQVFVEKAARFTLVGADAADLCRQMKDDLRLEVTEEPRDRLGVEQIVVLVSGHGERFTTSLTQPCTEGSAEKSCAAGDYDALLCELQSHRYRFQREVGMAYGIQAIVEHGNNGEGGNPIHLRLTNRTRWKRSEPTSG